MKAGAHSPPEIQTTRSPRGRRILFGGLRVVLALLLAFLIAQIKLDYFESYLYDLRVRSRPAPTLTGELQLIFVDPSTIERMHTSPGFAEHALLLEKLASVHPRAVVYDLDPLLLKGPDKDRAAFLRAAAALPQLRILTDELELRGERGQLVLPAPYEKLRLAPGPKSSDTSNFGKDGVTRRYLISYQGRPTLHVELARELHPDLKVPEGVRGHFEFLGAEQAYVNFRPPHSYPRTSFADVTAGAADLEKFRDKIIIVGRDTQLSERDYALTPYSREPIAMTSSEVHANIIDTLLRNDGPVRTPFWLNSLLIALISLLTVHVVFALQPTRGLSLLGVTVVIYVILSWFAFWPLGVWLPVAHPLLAVFLCYYFFIPYRLIIENRRSWEIYQKHMLLQQLEELKTNFISMMSHDLKTPIARILGMSDVIQRDPQPLSTGQHEALDTIRSSSEDLLKFINSILQYGRIEANQIELDRQSKDVNALLGEIVARHEFLAKVKRIQMLTEFEPLFPITVDPQLMGQVFSNLVENAIKYSPEDTKILISTEESNGRVIIQVADQGPGIPHDELPHLFMKFFRSKNAKSSPIKGSGLGLYLAKYFTELHGGTISVESSHGQGTTFTVELPLGSS